ncbi:MAG: type II secretion system rpteom [Elusimicrobia bacterium]|nr:MAG: type II secretion system rpteom [Elusimicrobiota bacterium]KAF0156569.1 MAG: type II secretion system rpteom [Elusimicrobiota bacterium]
MIGGKSDKGRETLGIYMDPAAIHILQVKPGKGKAEVEHLLKIPTGFSCKEGIMRPLSLNNDFFSEKAPWITPFKQAVKKVSWRTQNATVSFSQHFGILRYFVMPFVERKYWSKSIPIESKKYIPVAFEEVIYDFTAYPMEEGKKLGVLFGLTQRKSVEFLFSVFKDAGLQLSSLEMSACSMERVLAFTDPKDHDDKAYVHFSGDTACMILASGGYPVLYRESDFGGSSAMSERKRLDVKGAFQFVSRYAGGREYKKLMISGDAVETWKGPAEQESPVPVEIWEPARAGGLKSNEAGGFFALGAALRGLDPGKLRIDITGVSAGQAMEQKVTSYVWTIASVLGALLLLFSLLNHVRIYLLNSRTAALMSQVGDITAFQGQTADSIQQAIDIGKAETRMMRGLLADNEVLAPKLQAIGDNIPNELWLVTFDYRNNLPVSEMVSSGKEILLQGATKLSGQNKFSVVDFYAKKLKEAPELKLFLPPTGNIEFNLDSSTDETGIGRDSGAAESSPYRIVLSAK